MSRLASAIFAVLALPAFASFDEGAVEPQARAVLNDMVRAYRGVKTLEQESEYDSKGSSAARILKAKLIIQRPNRLLLEVTERGGDKGSVLRKFVSDGKDLYSYYELEGHFVKDKAPRSFDGFRELAMSVEMAALTGIDPFAAIAQQARSVTLADPVNVDDVPCDVVNVDVSDEVRTGLVRFYVGKQDHFLRKFEFDSKPIPKPEPKEKKLLPDLPIPSEQDEPLPPLEPEIPVHFSYTVKVTANPRLAKETFMWIAPPGALQLLGAKAILGQNRQSEKAKGQPNPFAPTPLTDLSNPTRRVHARELIDRAKKQRK
jgi:hypothetical protein